MAAVDSSKGRVAVAMSGGVDSSVTAGLLVEEGYDVVGVSLRLWEQADQLRSCSNYRGAEEVAGILGIPYHLLDLRSQFRESVVEFFAQSYLTGRTPNPCVSCNRDFKVGVLLQWATARGMDYVATGHYARVVCDRRTGQSSLLRGRDRGKDQSYFLFSLSQRQLAHTLFPLGGWDKGSVRRRARDLGLPVADHPESQDICFGDYRVLVESTKGSTVHPGEVVDRSGKVLGSHQGIHGFTVGQRKGLGIAAPHPLYVLEIHQESNRVVVGKKEELRSQGLVARSVNWIDRPVGDEIDAEVQVRYRAVPVPCRVRPMGEEKVEVRFEDIFPAVTPGQAAVFYRGEQVLGGGWIDERLE